MATEVKHKPSSTATWLLALCILTMICSVSLADRVLKEKESGNDVDKERQGVLRVVVNFLWQSGESSYEPVWPVSIHETHYLYIIMNNSCKISLNFHYIAYYVFWLFYFMLNCTCGLPVIAIV